MLTDRFGREITDLRVSVTNRCNFSCVYCHDEGLGPVARPATPHAEEMRPEEVHTLVGVAREFGVRSVKFTGGEPLVRSDLEEIVAGTVDQIADVSLTTNGSLLARRASSLRSAGLKRVNVSMDTLDPAAFAAIRGGSLRPVLEGIDAAVRCGLTPVKINAVLCRESRDHLPSLVEFVERRPGLKLQLIQYMPEWVGNPERGVALAEVRSYLAERADRVLVREMHHRNIYCLGATEVEIVDPVQNPEFCLNCHRLRVTHRGELKGCLNRNDDLLPTRGLDREGIRAAFRRAVRERVPYYGVYQHAKAPSLLSIGTLSEEGAVDRSGSPVAPGTRA